MQEDDRTQQDVINSALVIAPMAIHQVVSSGW